MLIQAVSLFNLDTGIFMNINNLIGLKIRHVIGGSKLNGLS